MKVTTHAKNYTVGEKLKNLIDKKLARIARAFDDDATCTIVCTRIGKTERMEVTIVTKGQVFRAQSQTTSMFANVDLTLGKIERQIIKNKERLRAIVKREAIPEKRYGAFAREPKFIPAEVMKQKAFEIKTLTAEQAELALDTIDHSFYVYANPQTARVNIMYKRPDGHVGIIEITNSTSK